MTPTAAATSRRFFRPTWAEIDLSALAGNLQMLRAKIPGGKLLFVVKANAYGHGAVECARAAATQADWLGVSSVEEGIALREAGLKLPVLVLGSLYPFESFLAAAEANLTPTVASLASAEALAQAAKRLGRRLSCHLKIETGMGRIGMSPAAAGAVAEYLAGERSVGVEGVYTHFARAEDSAEATRAQMGRFKDALTEVAKAAGPVALRHAANSAAAIKFPWARLDMIRPGLAAYGLYPGFEPVMTLKSRVVFVKYLPKGAAVSYGGTFRCKKPSRIATIPIGYADGLPRGLSNKGSVLIRGRRCPIAGRVTMDMVMADVSGLPQVSVGDEAVFLGRQGQDEIAARELATQLGTIPYEIACAVSARVPRVYRP